MTKDKIKKPKQLIAQKNLLLDVCQKKPRPNDYRLSYSNVKDLKKF